MSKRQVDWKGKKVDGEVVKILKVIKPEEWQEYELSDGSTVRTKCVVTDLTRIVDYDPSGNPLYAMEVQVLCQTYDAPEHLKKVK